MNNFLFLICAFFAQVSGTLASSHTVAPTPAPAKTNSLGSTSSVYSEGDQYFAKRKDPALGIKALELYRKYYRENPKDSEAAWRVSLACYFVGLRVEKDQVKREAYFAEGREAALAGIKNNSKCAACHFWAATNMALFANNVGKIKMAFSLKKIQEHLKKSIELDPKYGWGGAYRTLGLIDQHLPSLLGGGKDSAKSYFEKSIEVAPDEPLNYLFMVRLLVDEFKDLPQAVAVANSALKQAAPTSDRLESIDAVKDLKYFIKEKKLPQGSGTPD